MATEKQIKNFIAEIAPYAQKAYKELGKVLPSVCIGMACVESAYGTSKIMRSHNAFFGQKVGSGKTATKYWQGAFFTSKTKEEYTIGTHTIITSAFRAYSNMEQSAYNYYELLNTKLYARVLAGSNYKEQMAQIKACGYMTSSTEVNSVIRLIEKYNLTQYDNGQTSEPVQDLSTLRRDDHNDYVLHWQKYLQMCLLYTGKIDGIFGPLTEQAVKDWQSANGLTPDGIIGAKSWAKLGLY